MLLPLCWGTLLSVLSVVSLFWWIVPLYDVNSIADQPISKLRGLVGQVLLIITVVVCSSFSQITITGVLWRKWVNTDKKLDSKIIFPIMSGTNPMLWSWKFANIEIIVITFFGLILHLAIGFLQTQITVKYKGELYSQTASWLPPTLAPWQGNLSNPYTAQQLSTDISPVAINAATADDIIGALSSNSIGYANITQHTNDTLHFYTSVPKLNAQTGQVAFHTNSTYSQINQTHVKATINRDNGTFCIITFQRSVDIGTWIGCNINQYGYIFYDQTDYYANNSNVLNINNSTAIRYEVVQQCYHTIQTMNGTARSDTEAGCDQPYVNTVLGFDNVLEVLLYNLNSVQYLGLGGVRDPLSSLMYLTTWNTDLEQKIQDDTATLIFTLCTWGNLVYLDPGSYIYPYTLTYFTSGNMNNKWFIIIIIPIVVTIITLFNLKNVDTKMSKKLAKQYWLLEAMVEHGEWKAISKDDRISLLLQNEEKTL